MKTRQGCPPSAWLIWVALVSLCSLAPVAVARRVSVKRADYHGWPDSLIIGNGQVEAVIVPAVGRVMQFRFAGEAGPWWENRALDGRAPDPQATIWGNFGGDKAWPAPQADWPTVAERGWPPPPAFDSMPVTASVSAGTVELVSPVDPHYGIRARRRIQLDPERPVMTITTAYEKVAGEPKRVAVWVVTQLQDPVGVYLPLPQASRYPEGYNRQSRELPPGLKVESGLLSLTRDPKASHKIGSDAGTLLWVGEKYVLRIDSPRVPEAEYPDQGSSAEVYTNPDPAAYVELEMLGPLSTLRVGERITRTSTYTLRRRTEKGATDEARKLLSR